MKKLLSLIFVIVLLTGCKSDELDTSHQSEWKPFELGNKKILDTAYQFNYAIIKLPDGKIINTKIKSWNDGGGVGDIGWIQIWTEDNYYYTALENVILSYKEIKE